MTQAQTQNTSNTIIFVEKIVSWDGYLLLDDEYSVMQPILLINKNDIKKYKRYYIDPKHGLYYVDLRVPKHLFYELLRVGAVRNVGNEITAWHWDPLKAVPILQKHGYVVNQGWYTQYLSNFKANEKAMKKVREYEQKYGRHSYGIKNGVLWYLLNDSIIVYDGHTNKEYVSNDYTLRDQLVEKYDPLNEVLG